MSRSNQNRLMGVQTMIAGRRDIVTFADISSVFGISTATARRDLDALEQLGLVKRIPGGAVVIETAPPQAPFLNRCRDQVEEKAAIGAAVANLIQDGETIFLGGGTTVHEVAKGLAERDQVTVITNSLQVINTFATAGQTRLVVLGGVFRYDEATIYGHFAEMMLAGIHVDRVILGARSISLTGGITNDIGPDISTERAILQIGREVIIAADYTKFNRVSTVNICPLSRIGKIVTDSGIPAHEKDAIEEAGVEVIIA
ncbi:MAG: hypothetical protein B6D39_08045 [Anaerolineae bacterium UTCFX2]|nr:DeoR/GlpR transcriptional regulator [Anaerolineae bacterium]MCZ7554340.1 DeoR/GlpR family DNA-binding transcription regulator [Anaerolineales bacterium]OQY90485.1 MAG: hypothetical protein B6D39_08045 [Anaerolineae bacterium UTCFX2]